MNKGNVVLVGYGGHGIVAAEVLLLSGYSIFGYCDQEEKKLNPFDLNWLGNELDFFSEPNNCDDYFAFIAIGNNSLRKNVFGVLSKFNVFITNAIHPKAVISETVCLGKGIMVAAGAIINPCSKIGDGVICNTNSSIDHECNVGEFSHVCPGTVLCGNVVVGTECFIGANSTVIPGKEIKDNITVGAGSVVVSNLQVPGIYLGAPARITRAF